MRSSSCRQQVSDFIKEKIMAGEIKAGERLKEAYIAAATGLGMTAVRAKTKKYGLRELYHQMHPDVRRFDVKVSCVNRSTGERREYKTMSAAERALGLYHCALSQNTKNGKTFAHGDWEFRRAN